MKNNLEKIYQELGENICLYPFFSAFYQTVGVPKLLEGKFESNSVRPCSVIYQQSIFEWAVENNSIIESRNSEEWIKMRKEFLSGSCNNIAGCSACAKNEKAGATSARIMNNHFYSEFITSDIIQLVKEIANNDFKSNRVLSLDFFPSNYCNYECIMCAGSASSKRNTFEIKNKKINIKITSNKVDKDFYSILDDVEIINFTGGETVLQQQVIELIDYLIEKQLSEKIVITLLTNASSFPHHLTEKFKKFRDVFYTISVDGTGDVIEYQRRGCSWETVEQNAISIWKNFGSVINYVLTAVNVFSFMDFVDWVHKHNLDRVSISPVFREDQLSLAVIPDELRTSLRQQLAEGKEKYKGIHNSYYENLIDQVIGVLDTIPHNPVLIPGFIHHIQFEDQASKKSLVEVVPEWKPYFDKT